MPSSAPEFCHQFDGRGRGFGDEIGCRDLCREEPRCHLDDEATTFTFAFTTGCPTAFFSPREDGLVDALGSELQFIQDRDKVGAVVMALPELGSTVERLLQNSQKNRQSNRAFGDQMVVNRASSASNFVENIDFMLNGEQHPDWHHINR